MSLAAAKTADLAAYGVFTRDPPDTNRDLLADAPGEDKKLSDDALHPDDDLSDTIGEKRHGRMPAASRYISARNPDEYKTFEVHLPIRFAIWLEAFAVARNQDTSTVIDFAIRQIWRDDPGRDQMAGSMPKADFNPETWRG